MRKGELSTCIHTQPCRPFLPSDRQAWFDTRLSYNPAIHRTKQALFHGAIVRDLNTHPLPPPHPELLKYLDPPRRVLRRARDALDDCKKAFNVREVPKKVARVRKEEHVRARDEDEEMLLLDQKPPRAGPSQWKTQQTQAQERSRTQKKAAMDGDESETEEEPEEEELLLDSKAASRKPDVDRAPLPTPARSLSPDPIIDRQRMPGRIVGLSFPLEDFRKNISRGDVVTKAVEDLGFVIQQILAKPFSSRRYDELLDCMRELRKVALEVRMFCFGDMGCSQLLQEDEIDAWNSYVPLVRTEARY